VWIEVTAQAFKNTVTKPRTANVQRHRTNAGCKADLIINDYYKFNVLFTFVVIKQGLILVDILSIPMSIGIHDQIEFLKYYKKFLTMQESYYHSVKIQKWK